LIPEGTPPFAVLGLSTAMMGIIIAQMNFLHTLHLLGRPIFITVSVNGQRRHFTCFHYNMVSLVGFLIAQILTLIKIIASVSFFDPFILGIFLIESFSIITFLSWLYRYRGEPLLTPPEYFP